MPDIGLIIKESLPSRWVGRLPYALSVRLFRNWVEIG